MEVHVKLITSDLGICLQYAVTASVNSRNLTTCSLIADYTENEKEDKVRGMKTHE